MSTNELVRKFGATYSPGTVLFNEGDDGDEMYIIHTGAVAISKRARNAEQVLATLTDGDFFGEMAIFTDQKRSATATVVKKSVILRLNNKSFQYMINNNSAFAITMIRKLCERLKAADRQIEELLILSQETRLLKALASYWNIAGTKDKSGEILLLPYEGFLQYTRKYQGISHEDATRNLLKLKNQQLVTLRKDITGKIYLAFSPKIFAYFNITI